MESRVSGDGYCRPHLACPEVWRAAPDSPRYTAPPNTLSASEWPLGKKGRRGQQEGSDLWGGKSSHSAPKHLSLRCLQAENVYNQPRGQKLLPERNKDVSVGGQAPLLESPSPRDKCANSQGHSPRGRLGGTRKIWRAASLIPSSKAQWTVPHPNSPLTLDFSPWRQQSKGMESERIGVPGKAQTFK